LRPFPVYCTYNVIRKSISLKDPSSYIQGLMRNRSHISHLLDAYEASLRDEHATPLLEEDYTKLASYFIDQIQWDKALKVINRALQTYSFSPDLLLRKIELLLETYQVHEALQAVEQARLIAPHDVELRYWYAKALAMQGNYRAAEDVLDDLKQEGIDILQPDIALLEAFMLEQEEQYESMFYTLKAIVKEFPQHEEALHRLGTCIELTRKYEESVLLHEELIDAYPYNAYAWYNLAQAHAYRGAYDQAIEAYEFAIVADESFEAAYRDCAVLCFEMQRFRQSLKWYQELIEQFEPEAELFFKIGQCHFQLKQTTIARTFYQQSLQLDPFNDEVYFAIGQAYASDEAWSFAITNYEKAIAIEDQQEDYFGALAIAHLQLSDTEKGEAYFEKAIDLAPDEPLYWEMFATYLVNDDRSDEAFQLLEAADEYTTSGALLYIKIACLFKEGRRQEAFYWLGEALIEDLAGCGLLFELCPELEQDSSIINLIASYT
jgi:tetratricopeptide (TPR) repeat protein